MGLKYKSKLHQSTVPLHGSKELPSSSSSSSLLVMFSSLARPWSLSRLCDSCTLVLGLPPDRCRSRSLSSMFSRSSDMSPRVVDGTSSIVDDALDVPPVPNETSSPLFRLLLLTLVPPSLPVALECPIKLWLSIERSSCSSLFRMSSRSVMALGGAAINQTALTKIAIGIRYHSVKSQ